jgi:hypothetical protein
MTPILADFLKFAKTLLGGRIPTSKTNIDANTPQALSEAMGLFHKACEELEEVKRPTAFEDELAKFKKRKGVSSSKDNLRELDGSGEEDSDEGEATRDKTKSSGRSTGEVTKAKGKRESDGSSEEDSDEDETVRKKSKLSGRSAEDSTEGASKTKEDSGEGEPVSKKRNEAEWQEHQRHYQESF